MKTLRYSKHLKTYCMDNSTHDRSEMLVRYLDGELPGPKRLELEAWLANDPSLRLELESLQQAREAIRLKGLRQRVAGIHAKIMRERKGSVKKISQASRIIRFSLSIAAAILLVFGGLTAYNYYMLSPSKVFTENYFSYELNNTRDAGTRESEIRKAYREKDFGRVSKLGEKAGNGDDILLAAMAHMELRQFTEAIEKYREVLDLADATRDKMTRETAEYYLSLAYIANRDFDFALANLSAIREDPYHIYHEKVTGKLIRQVNRLKWR